MRDSASFARSRLSIFSLLVVFAAFSVFSFLAPGSAAAAPAKLLFEERRPGRDARAHESAEAALGELRRHLAAREVLVDPRAIAAGSDELLPLPGRWDLGLSAEELIERLDAGVRTYLRGQFQLAEAELEAALELAHRNPELVVSDPASRQWMTQALASLALARMRLGDRRGAREAMAEQVRSFPEAPITLDEVGPRGEQLYLEARRALEAEPRGSLTVDVSEADARVYLNENGRGRGGAFTADLPPGRYRVLVTVGQESRLYRVVVHGREQARLSIDWALDSAFSASPEWIGLYASPGASPGASRRRARRQLARRLAFSDAIVVGAAQLGGAPLVWGAVYERGSGRELRRGAIRPASAAPRREPTALAIPPPPALARFAEFLAAGRHAAEFAAPDELARLDAIDELIDGARAAPRRNGAPAGSVFDGALGAAWLRWTLAGAGAVALAGGSYLAFAARRGECVECPPVARSSTWAIALVGSGAMSLGLATLLSFEARRSASARSAALGLHPLGRGGLATLGWQF